MTQAIAPQLAGEELRLLQRHGTNDAQAYQAYELGRFYWNRRTPEALKKARDYFQQAINRDSNYAMAYAGLANVLITLSDYEVTPARDAYPKAKEAARKALALDGTLADAQTALAAAYEQKGMYREAMGAFQKHAELMGYNTPRGEAIRTSVILNAEDYWRKRASLERLPGTGSASEGDLAEALAQLGEIDEAIALLERRFAARVYHIMYLKVHPNFDRLRSDPRFVKLMRSIRLEP